MQVIYHAEKEIPVRLGGYIISGDGVKFRLVPGLNDVPDADWEKLKSAETVKAQIESGLIQVLSAAPAAKGK